MFEAAPAVDTAEDARRRASVHVRFARSTLNARIRFAGGAGDALQFWSPSRDRNMPEGSVAASSDMGSAGSMAIANTSMSYSPSAFADQDCATSFATRGTSARTRGFLPRNWPVLGPAIGPIDSVAKPKANSRWASGQCSRGMAEIARHVCTDPAPLTLRRVASAMGPRAAMI